MKILVIKISSMGDLIQTLPAITEAAKHLPTMEVDWVAEESFKEIPTWHPNVNQVISIANRRWKNNFLRSLKNGEIKTFYKSLRNKKYDYIIDAQSNLKSALVTFLAKGVRYGVSSDSVRERGAHFAYHKTVSVPRTVNHCLRMRQIFSKIFQYTIDDSEIDYGIDFTLLPKVNIEIPDPFIFLTHTASRDNKLWPLENWEWIIQQCIELGYSIVLPWWSEAEKMRADQLSKISKKVILLPKLSLSEKVPIIQQAAAMISCDTGLAHLAAALNIPNVVLYGPKDPTLHATMGQKQRHLFAHFPACAPCDRSQCYKKEKNSFYSPCLEKISAQQVLSEIVTLLRK